MDAAEPAGRHHQDHVPRPAVGCQMFDDGVHLRQVPGVFAGGADAVDEAFGIEPLVFGDFFRSEQFGDEPLLRAALEVFRRIYDRLLVGDIPSILAVFEEVYLDIYVHDFLFAMLNYIAAAKAYITE